MNLTNKLLKLTKISLAILIFVQAFVPTTISAHAQGGMQNINQHEQLSFDVDDAIKDDSLITTDEILNIEYIIINDEYDFTEENYSEIGRSRSRRFTNLLNIIETNNTRRHPNLRVEEALLADYLANDLQYLTLGDYNGHMYYDGLPITFPGPLEREMRPEEIAVKILGIHPDYRQAPQTLDFLVSENTRSRSLPTFGGIRNNGGMNIVNDSGVATWFDWFEVQINGRWHVSFCVNFPIQGPASGTSASVNLFNNEDIRRTLWFGYNGGSGQSLPGSRAEQIYATTAILTFFNTGSYPGFSATPSGSGFASVRELWRRVNGSGEIPHGAVTTNRGRNADLTTSIQGNVQRSQSMTIQAWRQNEFRITVPSGVDLINETRSGGTIRGGGTATVRGGETIRFEAPLASNATVNTGQISGNTPNYTPLRFQTPTGIQDLGMGISVDPTDTISIRVDFTRQYGSARIQKNSATTGRVIPGTTFELQRRNADDTSWNATNGAQIITTNDNGHATFEGLRPDRRYRVREIDVPAPYILDSRWHEIDVNPAGRVTLHVYNEQATGKITVYKYGEGDVVIPGTTFEIRGANFTHQETTDEDGRVVFSNLPLTNQETTFEIEEISVPKPWVLPPEDERIQTVILTHESPTQSVVQNTITFVNELYRGYFTIQKYMEVATSDENNDLVFKFITGEPAVGNTFTVWDATGEIVDTIVTDENGSATSVMLPYGTYTMKETYVPNPMYAANPTLFIIEIGFESVTITDMDGNVVSETTGDQTTVRIENNLIDSSVSIATQAHIGDGYTQTFIPGGLVKMFDDVHIEHINILPGTMRAFRAYLFATLPSGEIIDLYETDYIEYIVTSSTQTFRVYTTVDTSQFQEGTIFTWAESAYRENMLDYGNRWLRDYEHNFDGKDMNQTLFPTILENFIDPEEEESPLATIAPYLPQTGINSTTSVLITGSLFIIIGLISVHIIKNKSFNSAEF